MSPVKDVTPDLIRRCLNKEEEAWKELIEKIRYDSNTHIRSILYQHRLGHLISGHLEAIENYFYGELYTFLHHYNFTDFGVWISVVRRSKAIQYLRKELRHQTHLVSADVLNLPKEGKHEHVPADAPDESGILQGYLLEQIRERLKKMPVKYALVFQMYFFAQLPCKEISRLLGRKENTVRTQLFRAIKAMQDLIEKEEKEGDERLEKNRSDLKKN